MNIFMFVCFMFVGIQSYTTQQTAIIHNPHDLLSYAQSHNLNLPENYTYHVTYEGNVIEQGYMTLNQHGSCYEPTDPISKIFIADVIESSFTQKSVAVCDIGCGMGLLARKLFKLSMQNTHGRLKYTAIDLSKDHLAIATQEVEKNLSATVHLNEAWFPIETAFPNISIDSKFRHIIAFNVAHFWTPEQCIESLQKIESLLTDGGKAYISTMHPSATIFGHGFQKWYEGRKEHMQFPGYIANLPETVEEFLQLGYLSKEQVDDAFKKQLAPHILFLTTEELCNMVEEHTHLHVEYTCTLEKWYGPKKQVHSGIIVRK